MRKTLVAAALAALCCTAPHAEVTALDRAVMSYHVVGDVSSAKTGGWSDIVNWLKGQEKPADAAAVEAAAPEFVRAVLAALETPTADPVVFETVFFLACLDEIVPKDVAAACVAKVEDCARVYEYTRKIREDEASVNRAIARLRQAGYGKPAAQ